MDATQLDGVSVVLGAIAASARAGAGDAVKDMTKAAIVETRDRLAALLRRRLQGDPVGDAKLTVYTADPTPANGQALQGHLVDAGIDADEEILTLAREVLQAVGPAALAPGAVAANVISQINKDGGTGFIGGQHVHHHGVAATSPGNAKTLDQLAQEAAENCRQQGFPLKNFKNGASKVKGWPVPHSEPPRVDKRGNVGGPPGSWWETATVYTNYYISEDGHLRAERRDLYEGTDWVFRDPPYEETYETNPPIGGSKKQMAQLRRAVESLARTRVVRPD